MASLWLSDPTVVNKKQVLVYLPFDDLDENQGDISTLDFLVQRLWQETHFPDLGHVSPKSSFNFQMT